MHINGIYSAFSFTIVIFSNLLKYILSKLTKIKDQIKKEEKTQYMTTEHRIKKNLVKLSTITLLSIFTPVSIRYSAFYLVAGVGKSNDRPQPRKAKIQATMQWKNWAPKKTWKQSGEWGGFLN